MYVTNKMYLSRLCSAMFELCSLDKKKIKFEKSKKLCRLIRYTKVASLQYHLYSKSISLCPSIHLCANHLVKYFSNIIKSFNEITQIFTYLYIFAN